jgi:UDP-glucuronate decarboxylase
MGTCIVTGGAGFLGSHMCDHLLAGGHRVICVDNLDTGSLQNVEHIRSREFNFIQHDLTEPFFIAEPVDVVYHLASPASPIDYLRLPLHTLKVGSYGTHHMLGLAKLHRARFVLASTSEVYGDPQVHPQPESYWGHVNPIGPRGVYDEAKRYAEALTMAYHRQQGVDTGIVRTFNSVLADEQILYDDGRELRRERAIELAARMATFATSAVYEPKRPGGGTIAMLERPSARAVEYPLTGHSVPAFDTEGESVSARADAFIGHPTRQRCFEVSTRYGRSIKVTGDHSLFVEGPEGEPVAKPVNELEIGERIAVARRIDVPERDRPTVSMIEVWRWAEGDPWDLFVEAPGLGEAAWERRKELFGLLVSKNRNRGLNWRNGAWTKLIRSRRTNSVPLPVLWRLGSVADREAKVRSRGGRRSLPLKIEITDDFLWFLGVWVAEGSWAESDGDGFICVSSDQDVVDRTAEFVERHLGLHAVRAAPRPGTAPAAYFHSKLLLRLMEFLGFGHRKRGIPGWILGLPTSRLKWFIEGYREGDGVHSGIKFADGKLHEFSTVNEELKDDLVVALARFGIVASISRYESRIPAKGERTYPFWRVGAWNVAPWSPLEWDRGVEQRLNARTTGDLVWAPVKAIQEIPATPLVFDFSVPGLENFWAGTGVMAKNTYGSRMRPHDGRAIPTFLRQALQDKPLTVFGDGSQTRSFCYVDDQIRGYVAMAESDVHEPVNIGNPFEFSLLELAEVVIEVTESRSEIVFEALPVDDPQVRQPDITRAKQLLGWEPEVDLREGLRMTIEQAGVERLVGAGD